MKERKLDLSVIVVVYNQPESLKLILKSLLAQDFSGSYEVIVTDDGSSPKLFHVCQNEFDKSLIPTKYVWQQDRHFRAAAARNNGIDISRGRILLFLDGDLVPALDTLRKHVEAHTSPKMMVAGNRKWRGELPNIGQLPNGPIRNVIKFLENAPVDEKSKQREETERKRRKQWLASSHPWRACFSGNVSVGWSPAVMFDENFVGWGPEDWEFNHRLCTKHDYTPVYRDDITAYHLETPDAVGNVFRTGTHEEIVMYMKNTFYFFDKCPELPIEEVFFGFPRFVLDASTNRWRVVPRPAPESYDIKELVENARRWLSEYESK
jgi:glycosyltransferase involved in cell wall biosynthesis